MTVSEAPEKTNMDKAIVHCSKLRGYSVANAVRRRETACTWAVFNAARDENPAWLYRAHPDAASLYLSARWRAAQNLVHTLFDSVTPEKNVTDRASKYILKIVDSDEPSVYKKYTDFYKKQTYKHASGSRDILSMMSELTKHPLLVPQWMRRRSPAHKYAPYTAGNLGQKSVFDYVSLQYPIPIAIAASHDYYWIEVAGLRADGLLALLHVRPSAAGGAAPMHIYADWGSESRTQHRSCFGRGECGALSASIQGKGPSATISGKVYASWILFRSK